MSRERWTIIANPVAGRGKAVTLARELARALEGAGETVSVTVTEAKGDAERTARQAVEAGATRVIGCGGDGTVHEMVNGLMTVPDASSNAVLGIVPFGRCNDLVFGLGLPKSSAATAQALLHGTVRPIDLGRVGDRYYATIATLGFDSEVAEYVDQGRQPSFLRGTAAYVYAVLVKLLRYRSHWVRLKGDFGEFEGHIFLVATGNTTRYGGRMKVTPSAVVDDGLLDVCVVRAVPRRVVLRMLPKSFNGSHVSHPAVSIERTRRLEIETREPMWLWGDGEPMTQTPATIEVVPHALSVLVPQATEAQP